MVDTITLENDKCWVCGKDEAELNKLGVELMDFVVSPSRPLSAGPPEHHFKVRGCAICEQLLGGLHGIQNVG